MNRHNAVQVILDHYDSPRLKDRLPDPTVTLTRQNLGCSDVITVDLEVRNGVITAAGWDGQGCTISMAATSLVMEHLPGQNIDEAVPNATKLLAQQLGADAIRSRPQCANLVIDTLQIILGMLKD